MQLNDIIRGFRVTRLRSMEELGGDLIEMEHLRTGAQLCWLARPDENKAFSIAYIMEPAGTGAAKGERHGRAVSGG